MMRQRYMAWLTTWARETLSATRLELLLVQWMAYVAFLGLSGPTLAAQEARVKPQTQDTRKCEALAELNLETFMGGPAVITLAHVVEVPATGLEHFIFTQSGYGSLTPEPASRIREYCNVTGYVAPQNKFVLKLPLPGDWNQKFFYYACGGFCGTLFTDAPNLGLARGYASATGNGGHESALGFDGVWAANAPELQEDWLAEQSCSHAHNQGDHRPILRNAHQIFLHGGQLKGRPSGSAGSAAVSRRLQRIDAERARLRSNRTGRARWSLVCPGHQ